MAGKVFVLSARNNIWLLHSTTGLTQLGSGVHADTNAI